jgi:hypothetical protein
MSRVAGASVADGDRSYTYTWSGNIDVHSLSSPILVIRSRENGITVYAVCGDEIKDKAE